MLLSTSFELINAVDELYSIPNDLLVSNFLIFESKEILKMVARHK